MRTMNKNILVPITLMLALMIGCKGKQSEEADEGIILFPDSIEAKWDYLSVDGIMPNVSDVVVTDSQI